MLPWEALAYDPEGIPGAMAYNRIPDDALAPFLAAREAAKGILADLGDTAATLMEMQRVIAVRSKHLKQLGRSFELDLLLLENGIEDIVRKSVHDKVLEWLPTPDRPRTFKEAPSGVTRFRSLVPLSFQPMPFICRGRGEQAGRQCGQSGAAASRRHVCGRASGLSGVT